MFIVILMKIYVKKEFRLKLLNCLTHPQNESIRDRWNPLHYLSE